MKSIKYEEYNSSLGVLIDVEDVLSFSEHPTLEAINIPYQKLLYGHQSYLNKNKKYFIMCNKNILSRKVVAVLNHYGYDVTQVLK